MKTDNHISLWESEMSDTHDPFEYDVAISFAGDDQATAQALASLLASKNRTIFLDQYTAAETWGKDVLDHLVNLYARKARYLVLLISPHYPLKAWTKTEQAQAQERAFRDAKEYILPIRLDDREIPEARATSIQGLLETTVDLLEQKLAQRPRRSEPPHSHDLRSGNVPPAHPEMDDR
jgi:hypothetical protein